VRLHSVFVLRTADPPIESVNGRTVREIRRIGKRIAIGVEDGAHSIRQLKGSKIEIS
jgi:formamidopyrimidine-DNA glycosylase